MGDRSVDEDEIPPWPPHHITNLFTANKNSLKKAMLFGIGLREITMEFQNNGKQTSSTFSLSYNPYSVEQAESWKDQETKDANNEQIEEAQDTTCSSCLTTYTEETSFSGLKYVGQRGSFYRRLFWLLVVLAASCGLSYQIYRSTTKFFIERPTNTKFSFKEEDVLEFPAVTFCNTNMFRFDKMLSAYGWLDLVFYGLALIRQLFPQLGLSDRRDQEFPVPEKFPGNASLLDFILYNAHEKDVMIHLCRFNGKDCGPDNFTRTVTNYGVCYTFNSILSQQSLPVHTPGETRGLSVFLNSEQSQHIAAPRENAGFKMLVHPKDELPNIQDYGMELQLGTHSTIRINTRELKLLSAPYGKCVKDGKQDLKYYGGNYTKSKCLIECERDYIVNECGCRTYYMPGNSSSFCSPPDLIHCFYDAIDDFNGNKHSICNCEESCEQTVYVTSASQSTFPSYSVYTALAIAEDVSFESVAFFEKLTGILSLTIYHIAGDVAYNGFKALLNNITDENDNPFHESYSESVEFITRNVSGTLWSMQYDMFYAIADHTYDEIKNLSQPGNSNDASIGSPIYMDIERWLFTETDNEPLKYLFGEGLKHEYYSTTQNVSFTQYVDMVYEKYNIEGLFYDMFQEGYRDIHELLLTTGITIFTEADFKELTTHYLRNNIVHVDIFFGDLKVERITEQADYEFFQFICDWGGALGLFFGASLLSFIETMDFCFCRRFKNKRDVETGL